jgi:selenide,water dikinase
MGPDALAQVLRPLTIHTHPDLVVGLQTSDDAAVFRVTDDIAIVQTVDFFTPIVDDPFTYGSIAAANSMSDVYAMGGDVQFALNIVAFPDDIDPAVLTAILTGAADKVTEAGGVIAGGHTVNDKEPKFGLSVTGLIHPDRIWRKSGALPGDRLYLTKPIGTGVIATALKNGAANAIDVDRAVESMAMLNRASSEAARGIAVSACTDITGFGLLGHAFEIADRSRVRLELQAGDIPLLPGSLEYVSNGQIPGGLRRNQNYFEAAGVRLDPAIESALAALLFDPQTSGGLLFALPSHETGTFEEALAGRDVAFWCIGSVHPGSGIDVVP